jgi:hypothetical protein
MNNEMESMWEEAITNHHLNWEACPSICLEGLTKKNPWMTSLGADIATWHLSWVLLVSSVSWDLQWKNGYHQNCQEAVVLTEFQHLKLCSHFSYYPLLLCLSLPDETALSESVSIMKPSSLSLVIKFCTILYKNKLHSVESNNTGLPLLPSA